MTSEDLGDAVRYQMDMNPFENEGHARAEAHRLCCSRRQDFVPGLLPNETLGEFRYGIAAQTTLGRLARRSLAAFALAIHRRSISRSN